MMSLRAYARHRGCSLAAVQRAIEDGRISSVRDSRGRPKIADAELADREWRANTRPSAIVDASVGDVPEQIRAAVAAADPADVPEIVEAILGAAADPDLVSLREIRRRREIALWRIARTKTESDSRKLAARERELVGRVEIRADVEKAFSIVRTRMLAVAGACEQRIANLSAADVAAIEDLLREALEELSVARVMDRTGR